MKLRNIFYFFMALGAFSMFSSASQAMENEDALRSYRVQTSSVVKSQGDQAAHDELDRQAKIAPKMKGYPAYIVREQGSKWNRTQLKCPTKDEADQLTNDLQVLGTGSMVVPPHTVTPGQTLLFEAMIRHYWK